MLVFRMAAGALVGAMLAVAPMATAMAAQPPVQEEAATDLEAVTAIGMVTRVPLSNLEYQAIEVADRGAPHYSLEQIASFVCEATPGSRGRPVNSMQSFGISLGEARGAYNATEAFEKVKADVRDGRASMEQLVQAERVRQAAVLRMIDRDFSGRADLQRQVQGTLFIEATDFRVVRNGGEQILVAAVNIVNNGQRPATVPPVTLKAMDRANRVLADITYEAQPVLRLAGGERRAVEIAFTNMPLYTYEVKAHFGPGSFRRNDRDCPAAMDLHRQYAQRPELLTVDAVQRALDGVIASGEIPKLQMQVTGSRWTMVDQKEAFEVVIRIRNPAEVPLEIPGLNIVLYDAQNRPVGGSLNPASGATLPAGAEEELVLTITDPVRLPAAGDADPLTLLRHVALVVN